MKKETIFKHEMNESIQADAAMNCLKNRNKHKQINEVAPVVSVAGRMLLPMLRPVITKLVQKALVKIGTHARPTQVIKLVMDMLIKGEFAKKMAEKCGQTWNEIPSDVKKEIQNAIIDAFKVQSPQEQEESADDKGAFALKLVKKFKNKMTPDYAKRPEMFMMLKLQKALKKPLMSLSKEEYRAWAKAICDACESVFGTQEQEEEYITPPWIGRQYIGGIDFDADGNLQVITPDEDDDDDDYEAPPLFDSEQERHDIALATTYCLGESFIDNDGDLDDIYYAVLKYFDSTYDAPATADDNDILQWCRNHYKQIESMID